MRQYLAAVAGLFAAVGFASAQSPAPAPRVGSIQPTAAYTPAGNYVTPPAANAIQQVNGGVAIGTGCSTCGAAKAHSHHLGIGAGTAMPIGCSCLAAEKTFVFGSCSQFFNPGNRCAGGYGVGCGGGGTEKHPCAGVTSYLNR